MEKGSPQPPKIDIAFLQATVKKAGIRKTCKATKVSVDTYWNIVYGRSSNATAYTKLIIGATKINNNNNNAK